MVSVIIIIASCLFGTIGLFLLLHSLTTRAAWLEVKGEVCGFTEKIHEDDGQKYTRYTAIYKFHVDGVVYQGQPRYGAHYWNVEKPTFIDEITILHDPRNPSKFVIKRNGVAAGCVMVVLAIISVTVTIVLNLLKMI